MAYADDGFRFYYTFPSNEPFYETSQSTQERGGVQISNFRKTIEFQATETPSANTTHLVARILQLSNKGKVIEYYEGVRFEADISPTGEISNYSWHGGLPRYRELLAAAAPANRRNIFWLPQLPKEPLFIGDSFADRATAIGAAGETQFRLETVRDNLAYFSLVHHGSMGGGGVSGSEQSEGRAVFDFESGMWQSLELRGEGSAVIPGGLSASYKSTLHKQVARYAGCDPGTTGVSNPTAIINQALRLADLLVNNALATFPGSVGDLYAAYRHFLCPDHNQIRQIGENLRAARRALRNLALSCIPASASVCTGPSGYPINLPQTTGGPSTGRHLIQFCPQFFTGLTDDERAGTLVAAGAKLGGVDDSHRCLLAQGCYYDFLQPAANMVEHNPFAYGYYALERHGRTLSRQAPRTPCFPRAIGHHIRVRGGESASDPSSVQPFEGDLYEIFRDPATNDRFIRHNNLRGAQYYLHGETRMRFYLGP